MICVPNDTILCAIGIVVIALGIWWAWREIHDKGKRHG